MDQSNLLFKFETVLKKIEYNFVHKIFSKTKKKHVL